MIAAFTENDLYALGRILEYNKVRLKRRRRYFSRDGARYLKKPITPERYEEWLRFDSDMQMNDEVVEKIHGMIELDADEIEFATRIMRQSVDYSVDFLKEYSADGKRFKGKTSTPSQFKQWEQRKNGLPDKESILEKLLDPKNHIEPDGGSVGGSDINS